MAATYVPARGDLVWLQFNPQAGHEQAGRRPALVISPSSYNRRVGLAVCCPVTSHVKGYPFEVLLPDGLGAAGAAVTVLSAAGGLLLLLYRLAGVRLLGWDVSGLALALVAVAFLFGVQLVVLGLLGEYVGRVLEQVQHRPIFIVDDVVGLEAPPTAARRRG